jgi:hypothetical protein
MKSKSLVSLQETAMIKIVGLALGLFFAFASSGYAADVLYHGSLCNTAAPAGQVSYDQFGVTNLSPSFSFGIGIIEEVDVFVYDRNASEDVVCTLRTVTLDGAATTTSTARSSGSTVEAQFLLLRPNPQGNTGLTTIDLQCTIPPATLSGFSHLTTYRVISRP